MLDLTIVGPPVGEPGLAVVRAALERAGVVVAEGVGSAVVYLGVTLREQFLKKSYPLGQGAFVYVEAALVWYEVLVARDTGAGESSSLGLLGQFVGNMDGF